MAKTIWKHSFQVDDSFTVMMPIDAQVLTVQSQGENTCLWYTTDPEKPKVPRVFRVFGTGQPSLEEPGHDLIYISTFQLYEGSLVFHVFEQVSKALVQ